MSIVSEHMLGILTDPVHNKDINTPWDTVNGLLASVGQVFLHRTPDANHFWPRARFCDTQAMSSASWVDG